jgi:hypothetical protein
METPKETLRNAEVNVKKTLRDVDGHDLGDDVGNAGDEIRKDLGNAGDRLRRGADDMGRELRDTGRKVDDPRDEDTWRDRERPETPLNR